MKIKSIVYMLILLVAVFYFSSSFRPIAIAKFEKLERRLTFFLEASHQLNYEIAALQKNGNSSYDALNRYLNELVDYESDLQDYFDDLKINKSSYLEKHFEDVKIKIDELSGYIDEFKSVDASFKSLFNHLLIIYGELPENDRGQLKTLFLKTIQYVSYQDPILKEEVDLKFNKIKDDAANVGERAHFVRHLESVINNFKRLEIINMSIMGLKINESIEDLKLTAEIEFEGQVLQIGFQRKILLFLTMILIVYMISILFRLKRKTQEFKELNEGLEDRVVQRTKELSDAQEVLEEEKQRALDALKAKSDFLANMSHEIRTPMNSILGFSDLLVKTKLDSKQAGYLRTVRVSGNLLLSIIDDILDYSKLSTGKIELEESSFNLEELIFDVFNMIVTRLKDNPFDTYVDIAEDVPRFMMGDPTRLKQILVNLLGNAIKFTEKGSVGVVVRNNLKKVQPDQVNLILTVKDTGIGIPPDKVDKVFESFSQADETTTRKYGGTGLGLTITKQLITIMGGEISVESTVGKGSDFIITMPFRPDTNQGESNESLDKEPVSNQTVFIVDDNKISSSIVKLCCERLDMMILGIADSPQSALNKLDNLLTTKNMVPDIIYSDIMFDGMDGFELARKIRSHPKYSKTKLVAITADLYAGNRNRKGEEFDAMMTKPISIRGLLRTTLSLFEDDKEVEEVVTEIQECKGMNVLVVEDVDANRMLMDVYLGELGCTHDMAVNGKDAVEKVKAGSYDLILMDLQMPIMGGAEATKIIRAEVSKSLPIIALTAAVLKEDQKSAEEAGMNGFLTKPVDIKKLKEVILKYKKP